MDSKKETNQPQQDTNETISNHTDPNLGEMSGLVIMGATKRPLFTSEHAPDPDLSSETKTGIVPQPGPPPIKSRKKKKKQKNKPGIHIHITIENPVVHINTINIDTFDEEE